MELTSTFMALLEVFRPIFTAPSHGTFCLLMTGWILSVRHRDVTDLIISSDSVGNGHFSDDHRFFSHAKWKHAKWKIDDLWKHLAQLLFDQFVGPEAVIILAGNDTLCRKRGLGLFGAGMHHDPLISSRAMKLVSWGHDWVNLCLIVVNPWRAPGKVFALPICMRLYRNKQGLTKAKAKRKGGTKQKPTPSARRQKKQAQRAQRKKRTLSAQRKQAANRDKTSAQAHRTRPKLMREMLQLVAAWFPERRFLFVADSLYTGESVLKYLPENVDMIGAVHPNGALPTC